MKNLRPFLLAMTLAVVSTAWGQSRKVLLETSEGNILLTLFDDTPLHRDNFVRLASEHFYDSLLAMKGKASQPCCAWLTMATEAWTRSVWYRHEEKA